jgi:hypothetical protein
MDCAIATLIGVGVVALITLAGFFMNYKITKKTLNYVTAREISKISLEFKIRQLNELYGPLSNLVELNRRLALKLREDKSDPENWRLLNNLPAVLENPRDKAIVNEIIDVDAKIEDLIINKGGFIRSPGPPESFILFLIHYIILKLAIDGKEIPQVSDFELYPRELNEDVKVACDTIKRDIDNMLSKYEPLLNGGK